MERENTLTKAINQLTPSTYTYSDENKLTRIDYQWGTSSIYGYNGEGKLVKKTGAGGAVIYCVYDGNDLILEIQGSGQNYGSAANGYWYGPDGLIMRRWSSTNYYFGCDHLSSVWNVVTLDANETYAATYTYSAFGVATERGTLTISTPYKYVGALGYYADSESGLMLLGARYYNPSVGRFMTLDPIKDGVNWYEYCGRNPINSVDPFGLKSSDYWACRIVCAALIGGLCAVGLVACTAMSGGTLIAICLAIFGVVCSVAFVGCEKYCEEHYGDKPKPKPEPKPKPKCCERKK